MLWEIKAGDRKFRSVDLRQVIVYAALNRASDQHDIKGLGLVNPRMGISFKAELDEFCLEMSGKPSGELLGEVVYYISSGDIST